MKSLFVLMLSVILLTGCATDGKFQPLTPIEVQLVSKVAITALIGKDATMEQLNMLRTVLVSSNGILALSLREDLTGFEQTQNEYLTSLSPAYAVKLGSYYEVVDSVFQILVIRLRPLIDRGKTDLAAQYLDAVFSGAIQAVDLALARTL